MLETDRTLLDGFRRGEKDALTRVFRHYVDDVARTLRGGLVIEGEGGRARVGSNLADHDVESLVHETFLKAFTKDAREKYDGIRPYGAWLATIARNLLVDRARKQKRDARIVGVPDVDALNQASESVDPTWQIEDEQIGRIVAGMKAGLTEPDLTIFRMRFEEHMTSREAAAALGVTDIVVRRRDTRMRAKLLDLLRSQGFLKNARVRIGERLLQRRSTAEGEK